MSKALNNLVENLDLAIQTAKEASQLINGQVQSQTITDLARDVKIEADFKLHQFITQKLSQLSALPILSEEDPQPLNTEMATWIVDPIDGSLNFSRGIPLSCISISLWAQNAPQLGVIYDFHRQELFSGAQGLGAFLNNKPISVGKLSKKSEAICCTGFPVATSFESEKLLHFVSKVQEYKKIRLLGTAALSLAYVASGRADYYTEDSIAIWDVAAGLALVTAAGGKYLLEQTAKPFRYNVCAGNNYFL